MRDLSGYNYSANNLIDLLSQIAIPMNSRADVSRGGKFQPWDLIPSPQQILLQSGSVLVRLSCGNSTLSSGFDVPSRTSLNWANRAPGRWPVATRFAMVLLEQMRRRESRYFGCTDEQVAASSSEGGAAALQ